MDKKILLFNIVFYTVTFFFYLFGRQDSSSSLGYGIFIIIFWGISLLTLFILLINKTIQPKTILDKIGVLIASPILSFIVVLFIISSTDTATSESYFTKDNHQFKEVKFDYQGTAQTKRIEYYKSAFPSTISNLSPDQWLKDSTWVYLSKNGDTTDLIRYKNNMEIK